MKTIFADFNAMTEAETIRLTCRGSEEDVRQAGVKPGDHVWLTDGEILVGARLEVDPYYGLVGVPSWATAVHLDDVEAETFPRFFEEFRGLLDQPLDTSPVGGTRILHQLILFEHHAPEPAMSRVPPGWLAHKRAVALALMGESGLALAEVERALGEVPDEPHATVLYLELLRVTDLPRATREAEARAEVDRAEAMLLAVCIDILATAADSRPDEGLEDIAVRLHDWVSRFESAPGRGAVRASTLARVYFEVGQIALRRGERQEARQYLQLAAQTDPTNPLIGRAAGLVTFDQTAKGIIHAIHSQLSAA